MIRIKDKKECCGCTACVNSCPNSCISFNEDNMGFHYPNVDETRCVNCGICESVCPIMKRKLNEQLRTIKQAYCVVNKDIDAMKESATAGVSDALFREMILAGGVVYGCAYDNCFKVEHRRVTKLEDIVVFRSSKYVESDIIGILPEIKKDLERNMRVLFIGTPCQCAGIRSFLRKEYKNLYIVDIQCTGVPSPKVFKDYLHFIEDKYKSCISYINMRKKDPFWRSKSMHIYLKSGRKFINDPITGIWRTCFTSHFTSRPSCLECQFCNSNRVGDMTLGDYWHVNEQYPHLENSYGTCLTFINNEAGNELLEGIIKNFDINSIDIKLALKYGNVRSYRKNVSPLRDDFWKDYTDYGFAFVASKYLNYNIKKKIKYNIKKVLIDLRLWRNVQ